MGLIRAFSGALGSTLADQWEEYIYCDALSADVLMQKGQARVGGKSSNTKRSENIISDGSKIAVNDGQCMLIVENGKVVDFSAEPGGYIYQTGTEPSMFDSGFQGLKESFKRSESALPMAGSRKTTRECIISTPRKSWATKWAWGDVPFRTANLASP